MKIDVAATQWGLTTTTVLKYIYKGYIPGLSIVNNEIVLPELPKPNTTRKKLNKADIIDDYLCETLSKLQYSNYLIANIAPDDFKDRLEALNKSGIILKKVDNPDYTSTLDFYLSSKSKSISINPTINANVNLNITGQMGGININKN